MMSTIDVGQRGGYWWLISKSDPRWNAEGEAFSILFAAGPPQEVLNKIEELKREFGTQPKDLCWKGIKD
jgi:hypothetical protein